MDTVGWSGKKDVPLLLDAATRGYQVFVTNNLRQFSDPDECDAMKKSRMHHVTYELDDGLDGLARASGALCAALRTVVTALEGAPSQRLARVIGLQRGKRRFHLTDPAINPPSAYWR